MLAPGSFSLLIVGIMTFKFIQIAVCTTQFFLLLNKVPLHVYAGAGPTVSHLRIFKVCCGLNVHVLQKSC